MVLMAYGHVNNFAEKLEQLEQCLGLWPDSLIHLSKHCDLWFRQRSNIHVVTIRHFLYNYSGGRAYKTCSNSQLMRSATPHSQKLKLQIALDARYQDIFLLSALHNVSESGYPYYEFLNVRNTATATTTAVQTCCLQGAANQKIACLKGRTVCFRCRIHLRSAPMLSLRQIRIIMNFKWWKPTIVKSNIKHMEPKNEHSRPSIWLYKWWFMQWKCLKQAYVNLVE